MAAVSGRTHTLLREQGIAGESSGVIRQNMSTVRISLNQTVRSGYGLSCMYQQWGTGSCRARHVLQFSTANQLLYFSLACLPSRTS